MTAEIAILNREAVALAADSAVTIGFGAKIYNSANKLFCLSYLHPIGVMISGNSQYMEIPWETIIKTYRKELCQKSFRKVKEYAEDFIQSLIKHKTKFNKKSKDRNTEILIDSLVDSLHTDTSKRYEFIKKSGENKKESYEQLVLEEANRRIVFLNKQEGLKCFPRNFFSNFEKKYKKHIFQIIRKNFKKSNKDIINRIYKFIILYFKKDVFIDTSYTEIVFSGFGTKELLPSICSYRIDGLLDGQLRYSIAEDFSIGDFISRIIPFAQRDVVDMFMQGVDLDYQTTQESSTKEAMEDYTDFLLSSVKELKNLTNKRKKNLRNNILKSNKKLLNNLRDFLERYRKDRFQDPITRNTSILPKDELANMAESLVNLTSFKRRVSFTKETVGGPIDVAIITKGDGFIWIKRKHYFDPIYNHHYFRKYYHGVIEGGEKNEKE